MGDGPARAVGKEGDEGSSRYGRAVREGEGGDAVRVESDANRRGGDCLRFDEAASGVGDDLALPAEPDAGDTGGQDVKGGVPEREGGGMSHDTAALSDGPGPPAEAAVDVRHARGAASRAAAS